MNTIEHIQNRELAQLVARCHTLNVELALAEERATVAECWYQELYNLIRQSDLLSGLPAYHREKARQYYHYIAGETLKTQEP